MNPMPAKKLRPRPPFLRALGRREPPSIIEVDGERIELVEVFKHDSWAATALYRGPHGKMVVKFNRQQPLFFVPAGWIGRWLGRREVRAYRLLHDVPGIPSDAGEVRVEGRRWNSAAAHRYIEGHPLRKDEQPDDGFFPRLEEMVREMHRRGLAYVDLNKRENILVAEDGSPVLVDFQIHFAPPRWAAWLPPARWLLREFQAGDLYHLRKHILSQRPDLVPPDERDLRRFQPASGRIWRMLYVGPAQFLRRRLLVWLRVRDGQGLATSELAPEKAVRLAREHRTTSPAERPPENF